MRPHVGYYAHYHGSGHKRRANAILKHLNTDATVIASRLGADDFREANIAEFLSIPCDIDGVCDESLLTAERCSAFHYAPIGVENITTRVRDVTAWFDEVRPSLLVVDVSVEIALLARLASIPTFVMRQHGDRSDMAHRLAYESAERLIAPFSKDLEDENTPAWIRNKTTYYSGLSSVTEFPPKRAAKWLLGIDTLQPVVLVTSGSGGGSASVERLVQAAEATPEWHWVVIGYVQFSGHSKCPGNLQIDGWVSSVQRYLAAADVVVTASGHNSTMEAGLAGTPLIVMPEERPFAEQHRKAAVLERENVAISIRCWPQASEWNNLLAQALQLPAERWRHLVQPNSAEQLARDIDQWIERSHSTGATGLSALCQG